MRESTQRLIGFVLTGIAVVLAGQAHAQSASPADGGPADRLEAAAVDALMAPPAAVPADEIEEVTVRGQRPLREYRLEVERAREDIAEAFNEANLEEDNDVTCRNERPTGSRMPQRVCRSNAESSAESRAARDFLRSLTMSAGGFTSTTDAVGGAQVNAAVGTGAAQGAGAAGAAAARDRLEAEMKRLMSENRQLYRAVVRYVEVKEEYESARQERSR